MTAQPAPEPEPAPVPVTVRLPLGPPGRPGDPAEAWTALLHPAGSHALLHAVLDGWDPYLRNGYGLKLGARHTSGRIRDGRPVLLVRTTLLDLEGP